MGLPMRALYSVHEVVFRWNCSLDDLAGWAVTDRLKIVMAIEPIAQEDEVLAGLVVVPIADILSMFRRWGSSPEKRTIRRVRVLDSADWTMIADPEDYIEVELADLMILADHVHRFEAEHGLTRRATDPGGAPARYDWEGFYIAQMVRLHERGLPATQGEWIVEAQDWFGQNSPGGEVPDERTVRRRLSPIWRALRETE
ncbi:hypothetical protein [uncultured Paracoccus sp.]|uniref:hypothetical protein n=1 Tax=uncultured Paracoccus sp. TaxID=189685 RepID=UPI00262721CC|nr:hypothetical protein [uncultured Paracoccus sp.]